MAKIVLIRLDGECVGVCSTHYGLGGWPTRTGEREKQFRRSMDSQPGRCRGGGQTRHKCNAADFAAAAVAAGVHELIADTLFALV